jgi:hypothetical protein
VGTRHPAICPGMDVRASWMPESAKIVRDEP